jgi:hypothetical protein
VCVALAVLLHHEIASTTVGTAQPAAQVMHMPGMAHSSASAGDVVSATLHSETRVTAPEEQGADAGGCATVGMQHCSSASVGMMKIAVPDLGHAEHVAHLDHVIAGPALARTFGRAPPDLSVLSQLRI